MGALAVPGDGSAFGPGSVRDLETTLDMKHFLTHFGGFRQFAFPNVGRAPVLEGFRAPPRPRRALGRGAAAVR